MWEGLNVFTIFSIKTPTPCFNPLFYRIETITIYSYGRLVPVVSLKHTFRRRPTVPFFWSHLLLIRRQIYTPYLYFTLRSGEIFQQVLLYTYQR